ncbi:MAG TPA: hypothetical protein VMN36_18355 [Verrucomicrobiales bacterium]|nr:hypothetical protein [Verrucomicrobiales bacterium]
MRLPAYPVAIERWAASFPQEAAAHVLAQGDADLVNAAAPRVVTWWVRQDPPEAAQWAAASLPEGEARRESLRVIVQEWMQADPARAEEWIQSLPRGPSTDSVLEAIGQGSGGEPPD